MSGINTRSSSGLRQLEDVHLASPLVSGTLKGISKDSKITGFDSAKFNKVENANGALLLNVVKADVPLSVTQDKGIASIALEFDADTLAVENNKLSTKPDNYEFPLVYDGESRTAAVITDMPLGVSQNGVTLFHDDTLKLTEQGLLSVVPPAAAETEAVNAPLSRDATGLTLDFDNSLTLDATGKLSVVKENVEDVVQQSVLVDPPLRKAEDNHIRLDTGKGLKLVDDKLVTDVENVLVGRGAISNDKAGSLALEDLLETGFESLQDFLGSETDVDSTVIRLKTTDDFQQTGNKLAIRSKGMGQVPFYSALSGFNSDSSFYYNETLNELHASHMYVNTDFNPDANQVPSTSFVEQFMQSGSGIDISGVSGGRRIVSVRTDASLGVDTAQNLGVNPSAIVNGSSIKVDGNGKIASGLIFAAHNGVQLRSGTNNDVQLSLKTQGALQMVDTATIKENLTASNGVKRVDNSFQLDLQPADSTITLTGNSIKANYVAGQHVTISGNTISVNIPDAPEPEPEPPVVITATLPLIATGADKNWTLSKQPLMITGGAGIIVAGSETTGYVISSTQPLKNRKEDDEPEEQNEESEPTQESDPLTSDATNPTVATSGPLGPILGALTPLIGAAAPAAGIAPLATSSIGAIGSLAGGLPAIGGLLGGFIALSGRERKAKKDASGNPILTPEGYPELEENGSNVAIVTMPKLNETDCDVTRLFLDKIPPCSYRGIKYEYPQTAISLELLREYDDEVIMPNVVSILGDNTTLLQNQINSKVGLNDTIAYSKLTGAPDLSVYEKKLTFTGLVLSRDTANTVSMNTGNITTLGTLTTLAVNGDISAANRIQSPDKAHGVFLRTNNAGTVNTTSIYSNADIQFWNGGLLSAQTMKMSISPTAVSITNNLSVSGTSTFSSAVTITSPPTSSSHAATKGYVDFTISQTSQPLNGKLTSISNSTPTLNNILVGDGTNYVSQSPTQARMSLGLGSVALLNTIAYSSLTGLPTLGTLSGKNSIDLGADVGTSVLPEVRIDALIARKSYVDSSVAAITYNSLSGRPTLGTLSSKNSIDLAADVGTSILSEARIDSLIARKTYVDTSIGAITYSSLSGTPTLGALASKNSVSLTTDVTGVLPIANVDTSTLTTKTYVDTSLSSATANRVTIGKAFAITGSTAGVTNSSSISTPPYLNSTLNLVAAVNNGGNTADTPYPVLNMIKPGVHSQSHDCISTFSLNRYSSSGLSANSELVLGMSAGTPLATAEPNTNVMKWRADGTTFVLGSGESNGPASGALQVAGGAGIGKNLYVGGSYLYMTNASGGNGSIRVAPSVSGGETAIAFFHDNSFSATNGPIWVVGRGGWGSGTNFVIGNSAGGAVLTMTPQGVLSIGGRLSLAPNEAPPSFTTTSAGTKILINPSLDASSSNYSIGSEAYHTWFNVPKFSGQWGFKWYGGTTQIALLDGTGNLSIGTTTATTGVSRLTLVANDSQFLQVSLNNTNVAGGMYNIGVAGSANSVGAGNLFVWNNSGSGYTVSLTPGGNLKLNSTHDTLALSVAGGVSIGKSITASGAVINGKASITSTEEADLAVSNTGALQIQGGLSVAKNVKIGGTLQVNAMTVSNLTTPSITTSSTSTRYPPTEYPATGYEWNGYAVTSSSEYSISSSGTGYGGSTTGFSHHAFDNHLGSLWQTNGNQTAALTIDGTSQNVHYILLKFPKAQILTDTSIRGRYEGLPHTLKVVAGSSATNVSTIKSFSGLSWSTGVAKTLAFKENESAYLYWGICWNSADMVGSTVSQINDIIWYEEILNTKIKGSLRVTKSIATADPNWRTIFDCVQYTAGVRSVGAAIPQTQGASCVISGSTTCYTTTSFISFTVYCNGVVIQKAKQYVPAANRNSEYHYTIPIHGFAKNVSEMPGVNVTFDTGTNVDANDYLTIMCLEY